MTQVLADRVPGPLRSPIALGVPELSAGVIARHQLEQRLDAAHDKTIRVVAAPTGSGKTLGVARWLSRDHAVDAVLWLDAGRLDAGRGVEDRELFWNRLRAGLLDTGVEPIAPVPTGPAAGDAWEVWISRLARLLERDGGRRVLVLDDFPCGTPDSLGRQLTTLLTQTTALRVVITSTGSPALDLARLRAAGRSAYLGPDTLRLTADEVGQILAAADVRADPETQETLRTRTEGWALGVDLAAQTIASGTAVVDVLHDLDDVLSDVITADVLDHLPAACRELIIRTSVCTDVSAGLSRAIMGEDVPRPSAWAAEAQGFLELEPDGTLRCHPLLRRAARRCLDRDWPSLARAARRSAACWSVDHGDRTSGLALAAELGDWGWASTAVVRSLAVPSILLGAADRATAEIVARVESGADEPLVVAAAAIAVGEPEVAEATVAHLPTAPAGTGAPCLAHRLTDAVVRMAVARARFDIEDGLRWVREARGRYAELSTRQRQSAPEISSLLAAHEAAFAMASGDLVHALAAVESADLAAGGSEAETMAAGECLGMRAWLEALRGNLTSASRHAATVLRRRAADGGEVGVAYAQLAAAWVHLERDELAEAGQRLDHTITVGTRTRDPWLVGAQRLAIARVATRRGEPDVAVRLLSDLEQTHGATAAGWLADHCTVALAEAHVAAGDPRRALAVLTPEPRHGRVQARVLAALARHSIGDRRGARALLASVTDEIAETPLPTVVQLWTLDAEFSSGAGDGERALSLVSRALRAAQREELRATLSPMTPWFAAFVKRHPELLRVHRAFLAQLRMPNQVSAVESCPEVAAPTVLGPLTKRELQVLERLAQFLTTDEIAADLYVSANTVKTHIKGLFMKLSVNRRSDAVRRGQTLGLC